MSSYDEAQSLADAHRMQCGDDVILHAAEDEGWGFWCDDCDWVAVYYHDPYEPYDDSDDRDGRP